MYITLVRSLLYKATFRLNQNLVRKTIMTTPRKLQEIVDDLKGNPYYDKYADKIAKLQQTAPDEFSSRVEEIGKKKTNKIEPSKERQYSQLLHPKKSIAEKVESHDEGLDKIMKVDLIRDKSAQEIQEIWQEYHKEKECLSAVIPAKEFDKIMEQSRKHSIFLFPLPRSQGFEFIMCQFERNKVHFTPLLYYQVHKENAPECLTIFHYTEFKDGKGIVLMRGEYDKNVVNAKEAQCLANQLQIYYSQEDEEKNKLMETFTNKPDEFKHADLIKQIENIKLV